MNNEDKLSSIYYTATRLGQYYTDKKGEHYCFLYDRYTVLTLDSDKFIRAVMNLHYKEKSQIIKKDDIKGILGYLINLSEKNTLDYCINKRCTYYKGNIYIDACNQYNRIIEISKDKIERYKSLDIPLLERNSVMLPLSQYDDTATTKDLMPLINKYFHIDENKKLLLAVYMVTLFIEPIQTPILILNGAKGSGKTMCLKFLKQLVDPTRDNISLFPSGERDLAIILNNVYMVAFDNVSDNSITSKTSDMLCVAISGGTKSTRTLYTDNELSYMYLKNKIALNGIGSLVAKPDLLDRSLLISMRRINIDERKSSNSLESQFEKDIPLFLGSIYKVLQDTLKIVEDVKVDCISRLVDFCQYGYAIAEVLGKGNGEKFLKMYENNIKELNITALEENPVALCIIELMKTQSNLEISVSDLYERVCLIAERKYIKRNKNFPGAPSVLSSRLEEVKPDLEGIGIFYTKKNTGKCKMITLTNANYEE